MTQGGISYPWTYGAALAPYLDAAFLLPCNVGLKLQDVKRSNIDSSVQTCLSSKLSLKLSRSLTSKTFATRATGATWKWA